MQISLRRIVSCLALGAMLSTSFALAAPQGHGKKGGKNSGRKNAGKKGGGKGTNK